MLHADSLRSRVQTAVNDWCVAGHLPAVSVLWGNAFERSAPVTAGSLRLNEAVPVRGDSLFLVASLTKPFVAMALLQLVERGTISLGDRVTSYIPEFGKQGKYALEIRHLLTHTSGLPDMLPENRELRIAKAPLSAFVNGTCESPLAFPAGRGMQYQSMGFAILGELIHRVTGISCGEFVQRELLEPLGMNRTVLGIPDRWYEQSSPLLEQIAEIRVPPDQVDALDWNWNSRYWRQVGAPWGGMISTADDLAQFAQLMLRGGVTDSARLLSSATVAAATCNQLVNFRDLPAADVQSRPWGLGWRFNWPAHPHSFGDLLGPQTYGHWGATGTVLWIDPVRQTFAVILTSEPFETSRPWLLRLSNLIAANCSA